MSTFFDSNSCDQSFHRLMRDDEDCIQAYHLDDTLCTKAEFDFADMLNDEVERVIKCPWCDKIADDNHIRKCSGYSTPYSEQEIRDSLSDATEQAKRERLLALMP